MWSRAAWNFVRHAFPENNCTSERLSTNQFQAFNGPRSISSNNDLAYEDTIR